MKLLGRTGAVAGRDVTISNQLRIGAAEDNEFRLVVRGVSRHHARITRDGSQYWIEDAGSTNGTFLNGQRITRERLEHLDVITIGRDVDFIAVSAREAGAGSQLPIRTITDASFEWIDGPETGTTVEILPGELTIGRVAPSNVVVDSNVVSQIHCRIVRALDHVLIQDLESANGTYVNARRIDEPTILKRGDVVSVAGVRQFRMHVIGDTAKVNTQDLVVSQSMSMPVARDWQTRLVWSADELSQLEGARKNALDVVKSASIEPVSQSSIAIERPSRPESRPPQSLPPQPVPRSPERAQPVKQSPERAQKVERVEGPPPPQVVTKVVEEPKSPPKDPDSIANQPAGPKSVIPFVPPAGSIEFREAETRPIQTAEEPPPTIAPQTMGTIVLKFTGLRLSGSVGDFDVALGKHVVGRADDTTLTIRNPQVSRRHAIITVTESGATLEDLKSANGTFLNMQRVQQEVVPLTTGDILSFGSVEFTVELLT